MADRLEAWVSEAFLDGRGRAALAPGLTSLPDAASRKLDGLAHGRYRSRKPG